MHHVHHEWNWAKIFPNRERSPCTCMSMWEILRIHHSQKNLLGDQPQATGPIIEQNTPGPPTFSCVTTLAITDTVDYSISYCHVPGKLLHTADALSQTPIIIADDKIVMYDADTEAMVQAISSVTFRHIPLTAWMNTVRHSNGKAIIKQVNKTDLWLLNSNSLSVYLCHNGTKVSTTLLVCR